VHFCDEQSLSLLAEASWRRCLYFQESIMNLACARLCIVLIGSLFCVSSSQASWYVQASAGAVAHGMNAQQGPFTTKAEAEHFIATCGYLAQLAPGGSDDTSSGNSSSSGSGYVPSDSDSGPGAYLAAGAAYVMTLPIRLLERGVSNATEGNANRNASDARATALNNAGVQAYNQRDYKTALSYYQQALSISPGDGMIKSNLADAQGRVAEMLRAKEQLEKDRIAAGNMQQSIQALAQSLTASPSTGGLGFSSGISDKSSGQSSGLDFMGSSDASTLQANGAGSSGTKSSESSGLGFMDSGSTLKDSVRDSPSDQKVGQGTFGTNVANPDLTPADATVTGDDNNVRRHLNTADFHGVEAANGSNLETADNDASLVFDKPAKNENAVDVRTVATPSSSLGMPDIPREMTGDDVIKDGVKRLNTYLPQLKRAKEDVEEAQTAVAQASTAEEKKAAEDALTSAQIKRQGSQQMVDSAKSQIVQRTIYLKKFSVPGAAPSSSNPSTDAAGSVTPSSAQGAGAGSSASPQN
jgi:tetratricopeptide (TPR) repeat protein